MPRNAVIAGLVLATFALGACGIAPHLVDSASPGDRRNAGAGLSDGRPNFIVMVADDLGWMDTSEYGSSFYETPNIERLAAQGMKFTNAYAASPVCSPTRLSILTGKYPHRLGMTAPHGHLEPLPQDAPLFPYRGAPWQPFLIPRSARNIASDETTYGEVFRDAGYATAFVGKWHLGDPPHSPERHGFELVVGGRSDPSPPGGYFAPWPGQTLPTRVPGTHIDDAITDEALAFIEANRDRPFLLNLWFYSVHAPFQGTTDLVQRFRHRVDPQGRQTCPEMGAMIQVLDENIGLVLDHVARLGIAERTVILLWSDNGGNTYDRVAGVPPTSNAPLRSGKGSLYEGGVRVPGIVSYPNRVKPGAVSAALASSIDIYPTLLDIAGLKGEPEHRSDGVSLVPVLDGGTLDRDALYFHFPHYLPLTGQVSASAVRWRDWKLYRRYYGNAAGGFSYELYDLSRDIGERANLAQQNPGLVAALDAMIARHLRETGTPVPLPNPAYDPNAPDPIGCRAGPGACSTVGVRAAPGRLP